MGNVNFYDIVINVHSHKIENKYNNHYAKKN